jgi:hypothetical protein
MISHDLNITKTSTIEFLRRSKQHWHAKKQIRLGVILVDLVCIEEPEEDEVEE